MVDSALDIVVDSAVDIDDVIFCIVVPIVLTGAIELAVKTGTIGD